MVFASVRQIYLTMFLFILEQRQKQRKWLTHATWDRSWDDPRRPDLSARAYSFSFMPNTLHLNFSALRITSLTCVHSTLTNVLPGQNDVSFEKVVLSF